jgi:hypothetical protein
MRRTFAEPYEDIRMDGTVRVVDGLRFYLVADGREYVGDASEVAANDRQPLDPKLRERLSRLFSSFGAELEGSVRHELLDPETLEALEALGYAR